MWSTAKGGDEPYTSDLPFMKKLKVFHFQISGTISIWWAALKTRDTWLGRTINAHGFFCYNWWKTEIWFSIALIQLKPFNSKNGFLPFQLKGTPHSTWAPLQTNRAENQWHSQKHHPLGTACRAGGCQLTQELQDLLQQLPLGCPAE